MLLQYYLSLFLRRIHIVIAGLAIGVVAAAALIRILPPVYEADALLIVESEQIPDDLAASTVKTEPTEQMQIVRQRVLTRETILEMVNRLNVYAPTNGRAPAVMSADEIVDDMRERIVIETTGGTVQRGAQQATIVAVKFEAPRPDLAAAVTNEVVTLIMKEDVQMRTGVARDTLKFFESEVSRLDQELARRRAEIVAFKEQHRDALPDSLSFRQEQVANYEAELLSLEQESRRVTADAERLRRLHGARNRDGETEGSRPRTSYDLRLADLDEQLADLDRRRAEIKAVVDRMMADIIATPVNGVQLDTLQRNYDNVRAQFDTAVQNKAAAETGDMIEALSKGQRISVIEQAVPPDRPKRPNKLLLAAAGVLGGLMLGIGLVFLGDLMKPGIRGPSDLTARLGITPLAVIPIMLSEAQRRRRRLRLLGALSFLFGLIVVALYVIHVQYMPLDLMFGALTHGEPAPKQV